jgi:pimeloyl-ACP methyl ester carboxylesterase
MSVPNERLRNPHENVKAPNAFLMMLEGRAPWEYAALLAARPWLRKLPTGDGHPVLVFPGLGAHDFTTLPLRQFLEDRGYVPYPWKQGFNFGPRAGVLQGCRDQVEAIYQRHQEPISLIGWSLGGVYARELAKEFPDRTRCVITLGTPFTGHPRATNAWRFYELMSGHSVEDEAVIAQGARGAPGAHDLDLLAQRRHRGLAVQRQRRRAAGRERRAACEPRRHGHEPARDVVIADRLAAAHGEWKHFDASGARRWFFQTGQVAA